MNTTKIGVILVALLLAGLAMIPMVSADSPEKGNLHKTPVPLDYATKVAQLHLAEMAADLPSFSEWEGAGVEYDLTLFDTAGDISAYSFAVVKDGKKLGFILVSGMKENYPILEFGKGEMLPGNAKESARLLADKEAEKNSYTLDPVRYLYLGSTFYYAQYPFIDSMKNAKGDLTIDLYNGAIVDLNDAAVVPEANFGSDAISVKEAWETIDKKIGLLDKGVVMTPKSTLGTDTIYWVPLYDQPAGYPNSCAPTASAMILSYWRSEGYTNFPSNGDALILELYSAMGTDPIDGTIDNRIEPGIESVSQDHGYSFNAVPDTDGFLFSEVKSEVTADRPIHLAMHGAGTALGGSTAYGNHSVAVVGWSDGAFDALEINDGWSTTETRYIVFNNWVYTYPVYIRP